ncbi:MAG: hypothetical protein ACE5PM_09870, partial [Candidatus Hydrothermarchaeales archaeon]
KNGRGIGMAEEEYVLEEELVPEEEVFGRRTNSGVYLIALGTLILCVGVILAFLIFSDFSSQQTITIAIREVKGSTTYEIPWAGSILQLVASLIGIMAGAKLIDKGIALYGE